MARAPSSKTTEDAVAAAGGAAEVFGNPDEWKLLCSFRTDRLYRSTKALYCHTGCLIQVSTVHYGADGEVTACAEALTFVEGLTQPVADRDGDEIVGRTLAVRPSRAA